MNKISLILLAIFSIAFTLFTGLLVAKGVYAELDLHDHQASLRYYAAAGISGLVTLLVILSFVGEWHIHQDIKHIRNQKK